jgi:hypothetical protein
MWKVRRFDAGLATVRTVHGIKQRKGGTIARLFLRARAGKQFGQEPHRSGSVVGPPAVQIEVNRDNCALQHFHGDQRAIA